MTTNYDIDHDAEFWTEHGPRLAEALDVIVGTLRGVPGLSTFEASVALTQAQEALRSLTPDYNAIVLKSRRLADSSPTVVRTDMQPSIRREETGAWVSAQIWVSYKGLSQ